MYEETDNQRKRKFGDLMELDVVKKLTYHVNIAEGTDSEPVITTRHGTEGFDTCSFLDANVMIHYDICRNGFEHVHREIERLLKEKQKELNDFEVTFNVDNMMYEESCYILPKNVYNECGNKIQDLDNIKKYKYGIYNIRKVYHKKSNVEIQKEFETWKEELTIEKYQKIPKEYK